MENFVYESPTKALFGKGAALAREKKIDFLLAVGGSSPRPRPSPWARWLPPPAPEKFARFTVNVWGIPQEGRSQLELAHAGVEALADFIVECRLPVRLRDLRIKAEIALTPAALQEIADSCNLLQVGYAPLERRELYEILTECL